MIENEFKEEIILHLEKNGTNFTIKMLANFDKWKNIDRDDIVEFITAIKSNELSLYYLLLFFHLYLGVKLDLLYKELNEQEWKSDNYSRIYETFNRITYTFSQTSFARMKKFRISKTQLLEIRSRLLKQGLVRVRRISVELPRH